MEKEKKNDFLLPYDQTIGYFCPSTQRPECSVFVLFVLKKKKPESVHEFKQSLFVNECIIQPHF